VLLPFELVLLGGLRGSGLFFADVLFSVANLLGGFLLLFADVFLGVLDLAVVVFKRLLPGLVNFLLRLCDLVSTLLPLFLEVTTCFSNIFLRGSTSGHGDRRCECPAQHVFAQHFLSPSTGDPAGSGMG